MPWLLVCTSHTRLYSAITLHRDYYALVMCALVPPIGLYRENAIAIESEARDPFGGNVYYITMQITFFIPEFARKERNLHCDVVHALPPNGSLDSFWITRS